MSMQEEGTVRVWLVERTYSDDEQNMSPYVRDAGR